MKLIKIELSVIMVLKRHGVLTALPIICEYIFHYEFKKLPDLQIFIQKYLLFYCNEYSLSKLRVNHNIHQNNFNNVSLICDQNNINLYFNAYKNN